MACAVLTALATHESELGAVVPAGVGRRALAHPQHRHNGQVIELVDPNVGKTRQVGPLVAMADTPSRIGAPAPALGQHDGEFKVPSSEFKVRSSAAAAAVALSAALAGATRPLVVIGLGINPANAARIELPSVTTIQTMNDPSVKTAAFSVAKKLSV